jgi:proteasome lid subunit RPN8/RPN11
MRARISSAALQQIVAAAAVSPDAEICGLLFGSADAIERAEPCANVAIDPARSFEIDPRALIAAHKAMRDGGPGLIGCYHSHPHGPAAPSPRDAEAAASDGWLWLIAGDDEVTAWRAVAAGRVEGRFEPITLEVAPAA